MGVTPNDITVPLVEGMEYHSWVEYRIDRRHAYVVVAMLDTQTGERRVVRWEGMPWFEHSDFFWSDGNFGCDCNRAIVWDDERANPEQPNLDRPCGEGRFLLCILSAETGRELYRDDSYTDGRDA